MIPTNRIPTHPGIILLEEFLQPMNITQETLANYLNISIKQINEIIQEKDKITPEIAWLLAQAFNTTPQFWMNLQTNYDLALNKPKDVKHAITTRRDMQTL
jgi:addiction module HigA family antidote